MDYAILIHYSIRSNEWNISISGFIQSILWNIKRQLLTRIQTSKIIYDVKYKYIHINIYQNISKSYPLVPGSLWRFVPRKFRNKSKNDIPKKKSRRLCTKNSNHITSRNWHKTTMKLHHVHGLSTHILEVGRNFDV